MKPYLVRMGIGFQEENPGLSQTDNWLLTYYPHERKLVIMMLLSGLILQVWFVHHINCVDVYP